jgi:hypothetical protein
MDWQNSYRVVFNVVHAMFSAKQQKGKHVYNNRCFLWGPYKIFVWDSEGRLQLVIAEKPRLKDTKPS